MATVPLSLTVQQGSRRIADEADSEEDQLSDAGIEVEEDEDDDAGLNNGASCTLSPPQSSVNKLSIPLPRMDSYRFSMANLEDSQDVELDAILGELCALESQFDREISHRGHARSASAVSNESRISDCAKYLGGYSHISAGSGLGSGHQGGLHAQPSHRLINHRRSSSGGTRPKFEIGGFHGDLDDESLKTPKSELGLRTDSPDNDSAFSDNVSMLSSESSASSGGGAVRTESSSHMSSKSSSMSLASSPTQLLESINRRLHALQLEVKKEDTPPAEQAARIKAEKIKIALEKIREASVKKLFIKAYSADNSTKSLLVDERMTVGHVCRLLADKNHVPMDPKWTIVERIPELYMERMYEDHEFLVENLLLWTRDSSNRLLFLEREEKYDLFVNPEEYLLSGASSEKGIELDDEARQTLLEEFFAGSGFGVPEVEGHLYLKSDGKKAWKKHFFVLRASGLYYCPKGKSKLSKDLVCLTTFEMTNVYIGFGWKKKYKAPTDSGFAIKHPQIQTKSSKYIKYLCTEDDRTLWQWVTGIRIAKYGRRLKENYENIMRDIAEEDLDTLANARSFSLCSMAKTLTVSPDGSGSSNSPEQDANAEEASPCTPKTLCLPDPLDVDVMSNRSSDSTPTPTPGDRYWHRGVARQDSIKSTTSSSSGCLSERSSIGTPTAEQIAFDADFPVGTIKRKPSMTPKIPLTNTTRSIAKQSVGEECLNSMVSLDAVSLSSSSSSSSASTLNRTTGGRMSIRRSHTDERINSNGKTLRRRPPPPETIKQADSDTSIVAVKNQNNEEEWPLPPTPSELDENLGNGDDTLPPPPPEAYGGSTLSLDSLPPPPPPLNEEASWPSASSLNSLPPPPSPLMQSPVRETSSRGFVQGSQSPEFPPPPPPHETSPSPGGFSSKTFTRGVSQRRMSEADAFPCAPPPYLAELKNSSGARTLHKPQRRKGSLDPSTYNCYGTLPRSAGIDHSSGSVMTPKTMAEHQNFPPPLPPSPPPPPPPPPSHMSHDQGQLRPSPPRRNEMTAKPSTSPSPHFVGGSRRSSTMGSAPSGGQGPLMCPPETFLRDLQRVMEKKWKVAQQMSVDLTATPHQILGFRDPCYLPPANVEQDAIQPSHSSASSPSPPPPPPPLPEHAYNRSSGQMRQPPLPQQQHAQSRRSFDESMATPKKRPPPPPPKRSETTQLSRRQ